MTAVTANWQIPYATGSDPMCNGYAVIASMAARVDTLLGTLNGYLKRVSTPPYASVSAAASQSFSESVSSTTYVLSYDTVNADTGAYTNLPSAPSSIVVPVANGASNQVTNGVYLVGAYTYQYATNGVFANGYYGAGIANLATGTATQYNDVTTTEMSNQPSPGGVTGFNLWDITNANSGGQENIYSYALCFASQAGSTVNVLQASMFFLWIGDD